MKKLLIIFVIVFGMRAIAQAQLKESFNSNNWGWTEYALEKGRAYIIDGVMRLESKSNDYNETILDLLDGVATHAYIPMDPIKGFKLKCTATLKKFEEKNLFGLILNYIDDLNCILFMVKNDFAFLYIIKDGKMVGRQLNQFKLQKGKKTTNLDIEVSYMGGELEFRVNDVQALLCKYVPITSNGFGFFAFGKCKVDFDDVEILN